MLSIVTNACAGDEVRLRRMVPSWIRVFGGRLREIVIAIDPQAAAGRIAALHGEGGALADLDAEVERLAAGEPRVRSIVIDPHRDLARVSRQWFVSGEPVRCQAGTPIFAFLRAIEEAHPGDVVLRTDCDMLFHENGFLDEAAGYLERGEADLIEPPRLGPPGLHAPTEVSTRALLFRPEDFARRVLPIRAHRLDWIRRIHRRLNGRPTWLALEQSLQRERESGRLRYRMMREGLGYSLHVARRGEAAWSGLGSVIAAVEKGAVPEAQRLAGQDFMMQAWVSGGSPDDEASLHDPKSG